MNIKKIISVAGYAMLQPVSLLCKMQKSKMTTEEAHRILASVYTIGKDDLDSLLETGILYEHFWSLFYS